MIPQVDVNNDDDGEVELDDCGSFPPGVTEWTPGQWPYPFDDQSKALIDSPESGGTEVVPVIFDNSSNAVERCPHCGVVLQETGGKCPQCGKEV
jgi:hypothetical protein